MKYVNNNNKGFTFVEILAVVVIMGILSGIAIVGVSRYREKQIQLNYDSLASSGLNGYKNYIMKNGDTNSVTLKELMDNNFVNNIQDPRNSNSNCSGYSYKVLGADKKTKYIVDLCCSNYSKRYIYPSGDVENLDTCSEPVIGSVDLSEPVYTVTYKCEGADSESVPMAISVNAGEITLSDTEPILKGASFKSWNDGASNYSSKAKYNVTKNVTFKCVTAEKSYNVKYVCSGASNIPSVQSKKHGTNLTLSTTKPTITGKTFTSWSGSDGKTYNAGDVYKTNASITLTCKMNTNVYAIKYVCNGATSIPNTQTKTYGTNLTLSTTKPKITGKTFVSWTGNDSNTYKPGDIYKTNKALTLTCKMNTNQYDVKYVCSGASNVPSVQKKTHGTALTLSSTKPTITGKTFASWTGSDGKTYSAGSSYTGNSALTLTCKMNTRTYDVKYVCSGANNVPNAQKKIHGTNLTLSGTKPTASGKTFVSWKGSDGKTYNPGASYTTNSALTLTCNMNSNQYDVKYVCSGASNVPSAQKKTHGTALTLSSTKPTASGKTFASWKGNDGKTYNPGASYTTNANLTLTCNMNNNQYDVKYVCSGASNVPSAQKKAHGTALTLSSTKPTASGKTFASWTGSDGKTYSAGASYTTNANLTLTCNMKIVCSAGQYLKANATSCSACESGYYCPGGTFNVSSSIQGRNNCPNNYGNSPTSSSKDTQCFIKVPANNIVATAKSSYVSCSTGYEKAAHNVNYNSTSSACTVKSYKCAAGQYLKAKATSCSACESGYYCPGGTYSYSSSTQGRKTCPNNYGNSPTSSSKDTQCFIKVPANNIVSTAKSSYVSCSTGYEKAAHNVNYNSTSSACTVKSYKCAAGQYLKAKATSCSACESGYYCPGGTYSYSSSTQGRKTCPTNYGNSPTSSSKDTQCFIKVPKNNYVPKAGANYKACPSNYVKAAHNVNFNSTSACEGKEIKCSAGKYLAKGKTSCSTCTANYYCTGGTYKYNPDKNQGRTGCESGYTTQGDTGESKASACMNCKVRGKKTHSVSSWTCTHGHSHTTAYYHYCLTQTGVFLKKGDTSHNTYSYVCPTRPYGTNEGWVVDGN